MAGYNWQHGMSNNAVYAYNEGKLPLTKIAAFLKIPKDIIRDNCATREYHHTSKFYNKTDFYDVDDVVECLWDSGVLTNKQKEKIKHLRYEIYLRSKNQKIIHPKLSDLETKRILYRGRFFLLLEKLNKEKGSPLIKDELMHIADVGIPYVNMDLSNEKSLRKGLLEYYKDSSDKKTYMKNLRKIL